MEWIVEEKRRNRSIALLAFFFALIFYGLAVYSNNIYLIVLGFVFLLISVGALDTTIEEHEEAVWATNTYGDW